MDRDGQAVPKPAERPGQRERAADVREALADQREREADQRERTADEREEQIKELIGELRGLVTGAHQDALEAIERSQALLLASAGSLERTADGVRRGRPPPP